MWHPPTAKLAAFRAAIVDDPKAVRGLLDDPKFKETFGAISGDKLTRVPPGFAKDNNLHIGSPLELLTPTGKRVPLRVKAVYQPPTGGSPFGQVTISTRTFDSAYQQPQNLSRFVTTHGGATETEGDADTRHAHLLQELEGSLDDAAAPHRGQAVRHVRTADADTFAGGENQCPRDHERPSLRGEGFPVTKFPRLTSRAVGEAEPRTGPEFTWRK
jgi:hypothetical protein